VIYSSTSGFNDRRAVPDSVFLGKPFRIQDVVDLAGLMMQEADPASEPPILRAAG
jgi:hypothetical protein